jgi:hypothetical protein
LVVVLVVLVLVLLVLLIRDLDEFGMTGW